MEPGILPLCEQTLATFRDLGALVDEALPEFHPERLWQCWLTLRHWGVAGSIGTHYDDPEKRTMLKPEAQWEVEGALSLTARDIHATNVDRTAWQAALTHMLERNDVVALPTAQVFPFAIEQNWPQEIAGRRMDTYHRWMEVVIPGSLSGHPVISIPAGFNTSGLPMGLQLIGRRRGDLDLLRIARAYEREAGPELAGLPG